jgi:pantoate--beta-alanine ligase
MRELLDAGHPWQAVEQAAHARLVRAGFAPDYVVIRDAENLAEPSGQAGERLVALVAARLGSTRLIDNLLLD